MGEWKPLATIFSVLAISCAQQVARARAWGGELRDAKNATNSLSSNSLFPDKFIKKAQTTALTYPIPRPWLPFTRISNTNSPRRRYIAHTEPKSVVRIYNHAWTFCCRPSCKLKTAKFQYRRIVKKYPTKYVRLNGKSLKPLQI